MMSDVGPTWTVPRAVPSLVQRVSVFPAMATKYRVPLTTVRSVGSIPPLNAPASVSISVPRTVPSVLQS